MTKLMVLALILACLAFASTAHAMPQPAAPDSTRDLELKVPPRVVQVTCNPVAAGPTRGVPALPSTLTLRSPLSERAPSLTIFRFGSARGLRVDISA